MTSPAAAKAFGIWVMERSHQRPPFLQHRIRYRELWLPLAASAAVGDRLVLPLFSPAEVAVGLFSSFLSRPLRPRITFGHRWTASGGRRRLRQRPLAAQRLFWPVFPRRLPHLSPHLLFIPPPRPPPSRPHRWAQRSMVTAKSLLPIYLSGMLPPQRRRGHSLRVTARRTAGIY